MARPTELLKQDHRVIERMLKVLATAADRLEKGQEVDISVFDRGLDFVRQFADYTHHGKEEDILFNAVEAAGIPKHGGPVGVMLEEHDEGRKGVQKWAQGLENYKAGDKTAAAQIVREATPESLAEAVTSFEREKGHFDSAVIQEVARRFDTAVFREKLAAFIDEKMTAGVKSARVRNA